MRRSAGGADQAAVFAAIEPNHAPCAPLVAEHEVERGDLNAVASALLGEIQGLVGLREQRRDVEAASCVVITMPMLTVAPTGRPSTSLAASAKAERIRSASARLFPAHVVEHRRELLAAEPADEIGRSHVRLAVSANTCSTRSPIACPNRSLIDLK